MADLHLKVDTFGTCTALGIGTMRSKLINLHKLEQSIHHDIQQVAKSKSDVEFNANVMLGLKLVKATCDAFIALAAEFTGGKGKQVSAGYTAASAFAGSASQQFAGQEAHWGQTMMTVGVSGMKYIAGKDEARSDMFKKYINNHKKAEMSMGKRMYEVTDHAKLKAKNMNVASGLAAQGQFEAEIMINAINSNEEELKQSFIKYGKSVGEMTAGAASEKAGKLVTIMNELHSYNHELKGAFDQALDDLDTSSLDGAKRTFERQMRRVQALIGKFEAQLTECAKEQQQEVKLSRT
jgi:hypothetical protein